VVQPFRLLTQAGKPAPQMLLPQNRVRPDLRPHGERLTPRSPWSSSSPSRPAGWSPPARWPARADVDEDRCAADPRYRRGERQMERRASSRLSSSHILICRALPAGSLRRAGLVLTWRLPLASWRLGDHL